jgi:hypothetical protein
MKAFLHDENNSSLIVVRPHYGLLNDCTVVKLPDAEYAAGALHKYAIQQKALGHTVPVFPIIFSEEQYHAILSHVLDELKKEDGPTYMVITKDGEQPVFPHSSVDSAEEIAAFMESYPLEVFGPIELTDVRDHWFKDTAMDIRFNAVRPASEVGLINQIVK